MRPVLLAPSQIHRPGSRLGLLLPLSGWLPLVTFPGVTPATFSSPVLPQLPPLPGERLLAYCGGTRSVGSSPRGKLSDSPGLMTRERAIPSAWRSGHLQLQEDTPAPCGRVICRPLSSQQVLLRN